MRVRFLKCVNAFSKHLVGEITVRTPHLSLLPHFLVQNTQSVSTLCFVGVYGHVCRYGQAHLSQGTLNFDGRSGLGPAYPGS